MKRQKVRPWRQQTVFRFGVWMVALLSGAAPGGAQTAGGPAATGPVQTVTLEYHEVPFAIGYLPLKANDQTNAFAKDPLPAKKDGIYRGKLSFSDDPTNDYAFVWDQPAGKLFLDLNQNGDLTDDPAGALASLAQSASQTFTNLHLILRSPAGPYPILVDVNCCKYHNRPSYYQAVRRSYWRGRLALGDKDWEVGVVQDLVTTNMVTPQRLLWRPWDQRDQPFEGWSPVAVLDWHPRVFAHERFFELGWTLDAKADTVQYQLDFREQTVGLGEVQIVGAFVDRLELEAGKEDLVRVEQPGATIRIPTNEYVVKTLNLRHGTNKAGWLNYPPIRFSVNGQTPTRLLVGGPLTNTVTAQRQGRCLQLGYTLVGVGGVRYRLDSEGPRVAPKFVITRAGKQIATGNFQFG